METEPLKELKKMFDKHHRSFGKFILIITISALSVIVFIYISENILNILHGEKISFEMTIVFLVILGVFALFYSTEQVCRALPNAIGHGESRGPVQLLLIARSFLSE